MQSTAKWTLKVSHWPTWRETLEYPIVQKNWPVVEVKYAKIPKELSTNHGLTKASKLWFFAKYFAFGSLEGSEATSTSCDNAFPKSAISRVQNVPGTWWWWSRRLGYASLSKELKVWKVTKWHFEACENEFSFQLSSNLTAGNHLDALSLSFWCPYAVVPKEMWEKLGVIWMKKCYRKVISFLVPSFTIQLTFIKGRQGTLHWTWGTKMNKDLYLGEAAKINYCHAIWAIHSNT